MQKKHWLRVFEFTLAAVALLLAAVFYTLRQYELLDTQKIDARNKPYKVEAGMTSRIVGKELTEDQYPEFVLKLWLHNHPQLQTVQKGRYRIDGSKNLAEVLSDMVQGKVIEDEYPQLTIIEGANLAYLNSALKKLLPKQYPDLKELVEKPADFIIESLKNDQELLKAVGGAGTSLEGLLMPATYPVFHQDKPQEALGAALRATARFMAAEWPLRDKRIFVNTPYEALIVASIIERETLINDERPHVAAVFYNRLRKKMRLQTDPTVMYGISPEFQGKLSKEMLKKDTPYNTYTRAGLPPTPISMPSKSSILAALHPSDTNALYFVAADVSPAQGHVFTGTLDDHNKAVADYRRKVSEYKKNQSDSKNTEPKVAKEKGAEKNKVSAESSATKDKKVSEEPAKNAKSVQKNDKKQPEKKSEDQEKKANLSDDGKVLAETSGEIVITLDAKNEDQAAKQHQGEKDKDLK